jgi:CAAX protease family protein
VALVALVAGATAVAATWLLFPRNLFLLPQRAPALWLMIMLLYPLVSALPQELIFRPLFFRRYGALFPGRQVALAVNALAFSGAHLMYAHPLVLGMTLVGGYVFGWLYLVRGSFPAAVLAHAIAGQAIFTSGLGVLFYSGNVN